MATADKLALLKATKADMKAALTEQGQTPGDVFSAYPDMVRAIQTGENLDTELTAQDTLLAAQSAKIAELAEILESKAASGGVDTCTVSYYATDGDWYGCYFTQVKNGQMLVASNPMEYTESNAIEITVPCGSLIMFEGWGSGNVEASSGVVYNIEVSGHGFVAYEAPTEANSYATVILS